MLDLFAQFATDTKAENDGVEVPFHGTTLLIARSGNKKYSKFISTEYNKNQVALERKDDAADELSEEIMISAIANTILVGWGEMQYQKKPLPYSVENAKMVLRHKDFRAEVMKLAENREAFRVKQIEEKAKN